MNPILALILANVIWGGASPIFKFALENIPPFTLAFIRFFFAGLIFLPFVNQNNWKELSFKEWLGVILVGFFGITINISFFFLGIQKTESINAPVIASAGPVFIYLLSVLFLREKPKIRVLTGMLFALFGVLIIIFSPILLGQKWVLGEIEGNLFIFAAMLGTVFQTIIGRRVLKKISYIQVSVVTFLLSSLTFLPFTSKEFLIWDFSQLNVNGIVGIIYGVVFSSAAAYSLFYYGVSKLKAQEVGLFTYIDPIVAVLIAAPLLHEYPNVHYFIGTLLVFGGIYFAEGRINYHPFYLFVKRQSAPLRKVLTRLESFT